MSDPSKSPRREETDEERAARLQAEALSGRTITDAQFSAKSRRAFLTGLAAMAGGVLGWRWIRSQPEDGNLSRVLRTGHEFNEQLWRGLYSPDRLAPTFPVARSRMPRPNGVQGLRSLIDLTAWRMRIEGPDGTALDSLDLDAVLALPRVEMTTELKCVEGWSEVVHWTGARFSDLAALYVDRLPPNLPYVGLATPDGQYTVGMDMASMMHPQTLLVYGMQGRPLELRHGAPLRLVTPLKYGVKSLKRIGVIRFTDQRPPDFWAARGYDWYLGH